MLSVNFLKKRKNFLSKVKSKRVFWVFFILAVLLVHASLAQAAGPYDLVLVNSNDWVDVYNGLLYGSLSKTPVIFLSDQSQSNTILGKITYDVESILVVESDERLSPTTSRILESIGYDVEVLTDDDTSLFFADLLNLDSYILVDKNFPSNGLSVAPYAVATNSWVFFVNDALDPDVSQMIEGSKIVTYGRVPSQVLYSFTPDIVIDKGNKYVNSVEMAKEFLKIKPTSQYILTEGSFLEPEFFVDSFPVLIVGVSTTPLPIQNFFVESNVQSAVVVGQRSVPASVNLKRLLENTYDKEIKLVAKLGQTSPDLEDQNIILPLDTFSIPSPTIALTIDSAFYNQITKQLEVRFTNAGDVVTTYAPSIALTINGQARTVEAPEEFYVLERTESRTIQFSVDLSSIDDVDAQVTAVYGESQDSFDLSTSKDFTPLEFLSINDDSSLAVQEIAYDKKNKVFLITVFNNGSVPTYADIDLIDVVVGGETQSFSSPRAILVQPGEEAVLVIYAILSDADVLANPLVQFDVAYGQRNYALIKSLSGELALKEKSLLTDLINNSGLIIGAIALVVIAILLFLLLAKGGSYECAYCQKSYRRKPRRCSSCGGQSFRKK